MRIYHIIINSEDYGYFIANHKKEALNVSTRCYQLAYKKIVKTIEVKHMKRKNKENPMSYLITEVPGDEKPFKVIHVTDETSKVIAQCTEKRKAEKFIAYRVANE